MWAAVEAARSGRPPYTGKQPTSVINAIVERYANQVWGYGDRRHLMRAGEVDEYPRDIYWPADREM